MATITEKEGVVRPVTRIKANRRPEDYWREVLRYRELFHVLAWRDVSVRYKQTAVGIAWAVIRPFLTMLVFTVVFSGLAALPSEGDAPYALMVYAGILPWTLFATALTEGANSLVANASMITKVYFPRIVVPAAAIVVAVIDFFIALVLLFLLMAIYAYPPSLKLLALPLFVGLTILAAAGPILWISAVNVKYRDFRFVVPFIVQFGLYVSPVGFSSSVVPEQWRLLFSLNPMVGAIDGFRWCVLGGGDRPLDWTSVLTSLFVSLVLFWIGLRQFRRIEAEFADVA